MEGTIGEIRGFAGNFAPRTWALCEGQLLAISSNTALFSILGTTYGGDGRTTFGLPDLRGRIPISEGTGPGLTPRKLGERGGTESNVLTLAQMPAHNHIATFTPTGGGGQPVVVEGEVTVKAGTGGTPTNDPTDKYWAEAPTSGPVQASVYGTNKNVNMASDAVQVSVEIPASVSQGGTVTVDYAGSGQAIYNMQPYLTINWIICMFGVFPSRN